jgi:hypothetical protein
LQRIATAGHFQGIDVAILKAFADSLGASLQTTTVSKPPYDDLIPALLCGDGDLSMDRTITPERELLVDSSRPCCSITRRVLVHERSSLASLKELEDKAGSMVKGSSQMQFLRELGHPALRIVPTDFTLEAVLAVRAGEADFAVTDSPAPSVFVREVPELPKIAFRPIRRLSIWLRCSKGERSQSGPLRVCRAHREERYLEGHHQQAHIPPAQKGGEWNVCLRTSSPCPPLGGTHLSHSTTSKTQPCPEPLTTVERG